MVEDVLYQAPNIPKDALKPAQENKNDFDRLIRINDFSLSVAPYKDYREKRLEIKIIHKNDTMYICQPSGIGSGEYRKIIDNSFVKEVTIPSDFTLQFKAGHYYFPNWIDDQRKRLPETSGDVKILNTANLNQSYFVIPKDIYDSCLLYPKYISGPERESDEDKYVIDNFFLKGYFSRTKRVQATKISQIPIEYSWIGEPVPTKDANRFWGMIDYSGTFFSRRTTFFTLNKEENTIKLFLPKEDPRLFSCRNNGLFIDSFNSFFYLPVWIKQEFKEGLNAFEYDKLPHEKYIFRSEDEGNTWKEDKKAKEIFEKHHFFEKSGRKIEFLDKDHAVVFYTENVERDEKKNSHKTQGYYYLLKNMRVIDSIKSPEKTSYYANSPLSIKNENIFILGSWTYNYNQTYFELSLKRADDTWKFQVEEKNYSPTPETQEFHKPLEKDTIKEYRNFHLINNRELVFKNGSGKMRLKDDAIQSNSYIIENDSHIYLINHRSVYVSFDRGTNWYLYPASLFPNTYHYLFGINEQDEISYFSNESVGESKRKTSKTFYKFSPE